VAGGVIVFGGMFIFRTVAAADMPADQTDTQVHPPVAHLKTLFTAFGAWCNLLNLVKVSTIGLLAHSFSSRCFYNKIGS
jgi:hypothetical protein